MTPQLVKERPLVDIIEREEEEERLDAGKIKKGLYKGKILQKPYV